MPTKAQKKGSVRTNTVCLLSLRNHPPNVETNRLAPERGEAQDPWQQPVRSILTQDDALTVFSPRMLLSSPWLLRWHEPAISPTLSDLTHCCDSCASDCIL